jgi:hypothetical protein
MRIEQTRAGKMVRVRGEWYEPELRGVVGSVLRWHYEVEEIEAWEKSTYPRARTS